MGYGSGIGGAGLVGGGGIAEFGSGIVGAGLVGRGGIVVFGRGQSSISLVSVLNLYTVTSEPEAELAPSVCTPR